MNPLIVSKVQSLCENGERERLVTLFAEYCEHFSCIPLCHSEVTDTQAINDLVRENVSALCRRVASLTVPGFMRKTSPKEWLCLIFHVTGHTERC
jgi:hypothetical protein